ncbi:transcriptional regulator [Rhodococcus sp. 06-462-5]|uniref:winged helix-turn-helix transcriptional regulator n=1 Tax=Nocardiaceae TaxID=85025 RepID=UPI00050C6DC3|nr:MULTISPECIES: helix-turn-helix domain-containing protein [Rhodococcus]OZC73942.1 transcriptional regulator [Rhodococcus sp. 06-462-5]OZE67938.1 transcriptional regulator [Rhodococcus sp. 02-925g]OZF51055.1 transcriptional regulator [Rhodococcus sp. 14-1411-2a]
MKRDSFDRWPCSIARSVGLVGDGWVLLILRELFYGESRFDALVGTLGIARATLTDRLQTLTEGGIVSRTPYQMQPVRHEYLLTEKGRDLFGVIAALNAWGDKWMSGSDGVPVVLQHQACGHTLDAAVICRACGADVRHNEVTARTGPGYPERMLGSLAVTDRFPDAIGDAARRDGPDS